MTNENQNQNNDTVEQNQNPVPAVSPDPVAALALTEPETPISAPGAVDVIQPASATSLPSASDSSDVSAHTPVNPSIHPPAAALQASVALNHHKGRTPKIAFLPPELIAFINEQLLNNVPYLIITRELAEKGYPGFSKSNISNWKLGPFRKWLQEQQTIDQQLRQREQALDYARTHGCSLVDVLAQVNAQNLDETAIVLNPSRFVAKLQASPELFLRLSREISSFVKINREWNRHSPSVAKSRESQPPANPSLREEPTGGLTEEQRDAIDCKLGII